MLLRALKMAVLSYYYFGEKTNDGARLRYVKRRGETESQGPRYNVSRYARDRVGERTYARTPSWPSSLSLSHTLCLFFIFVPLRTTDRAENIGTPYVFPETRGFIEAIMPAIRAKTKTSL